MQEVNQQEEFTGRIFEPNISSSSEPTRQSIEEEQKYFAHHENKVIHWVKRWLIRIFGFYIFIISAVLLYHMLFPAKWRWLDKNEVASMEKLFFTGIGAGLLGKFGNKLTDFK